MGDRVRTTLALALALTLTTAACASDAPGSDAPSGAAPTSDETPVSSQAAEPSTAAERPQTGDGDIDWASVDLTTIDWESIDFREIDWESISDNPTAENLDEGTVALIQSRMSPGEATLTIGDETWEFDNFACVLGHENTRSDMFSFTTNSTGTFDGVRTQMQVTIEDPSSTGQVSGADTVHRVDFNDISDLENPAINWTMNTPNAVSIDGYTVTVEGTFNDDTTPGVDEAIAGTLEGSCSDQSRLTGG